jgi:glucose-fructose oxidoreductase
MAQRKVGFAVIGLGHIAQAAVLPAFQHTKDARLVALVSGSGDKLGKLGRRYGARGYRYEELDECLGSDDVDALYIATPNTEHVEPTLRAAKSGVHVLCEKPMATSARECERMIRACKAARVKLMIAYRLHFEPSFLETIELVRKGRIGEPRFFSSTFSYQVKPGNIRTQKELGGGALWDIGIYCINQARNMFEAEPIEIAALEQRNRRDPRFRDVHEGMAVLMKFPGERLAQFTVSFGAAATGQYRLVGTKGQVLVENGYEYQGERKRILTVNDNPREKTYPPMDQFAPELDHFSDCILTGKDPEPDGQEGLNDVRAIEAIFKAARTGRVVRLGEAQRRKRPSPRNKMTRRPVREPSLVDAESAVLQ